MPPPGFGRTRPWTCCWRASSGYKHRPGTSEGPRVEPGAFTSSLAQVRVLRTFDASLRSLLRNRQAIASRSECFDDGTHQVSCLGRGLAHLDAGGLEGLLLRLSGTGRAGDDRPGVTHRLA